MMIHARVALPRHKGITTSKGSVIWFNIGETAETVGTHTKNP